MGSLVRRRQPRSPAACRRAPAQPAGSSLHSTHPHSASPQPRASGPHRRLAPGLRPRSPGGRRLSRRALPSIQRTTTAFRPRPGPPARTAGKPADSVLAAQESGGLPPGAGPAGGLFPPFNASPQRIASDPRLRRGPQASLRTPPSQPRRPAANPPGCVSTPGPRPRCGWRCPAWRGCCSHGISPWSGSPPTVRRSPGCSGPPP